MKNIFILYVFGIISLYIFNNVFGQTLSSLTLTKPRMHSKKGQREYVNCLIHINNLKYILIYNNTIISVLHNV
jgi:hypothetical protein